MRPTIYRGLRLVTITEHVTASNDLPWFEASYYYRECYCVQRYTVV
jgi:hypothetical protein